MTPSTLPPFGRRLHDVGVQQHVDARVEQHRHELLLEQLGVDGDEPVDRRIVAEVLAFAVHVGAQELVADLGVEPLSSGGTVMTRPPVASPPR